MKKLLITIAVMFILVLPMISAEQVVWNNDSDIMIQDNWKDVDGTPLTGATCTWFVYNPDGSINQSGTHTELAQGVFNFIVAQLNVVQIYPMLFNCTKSGFNGTSTKDSIRIVDEITEDFKNTIDQTNLTTFEINQTTHMTYDLLSGEINDTLNLILNITNFTKENLTQINSQLELILEDTNLIVEKWGNEDAKEIVDRIKDLSRQIKDLEFRIEFVSSGELESRMLSIFSTTNGIKNKLNIPEETNFWLWFWIILVVFIFVLVIAVLISKNKNG